MQQKQHRYYINKGKSNMQAKYAQYFDRKCDKNWSYSKQKQIEPETVRLIETVRLSILEILGDRTVRLIEIFTKILEQYV